MFNRIFLYLFLLSFNLCAEAAIKVFACEPEWEALVKELGGVNVNTFSATTAFQDPHHIQARPSLIAKVRNADMIVCTGSGLESAWLPLLLRQSGNKKIATSSDHYFLASASVERIEIPEKLDRSMGDIHGEGNPHVHLDPHRLLRIAQELSERLILIDPENKNSYQSNLKIFSEAWKKSISEWERDAQSLKNKKAIVYHRSWSYLLSWLEIKEIGDLEPKPGIPPTTTHLVNLLKLIETNRPDFILIAPYQNDKGARWLSERSGIPILTLPFTIGGNSDSNDLFTLYQSTLSILKMQP
jgi:zinc/manganese transport system substrate-binding protein